MCVKGYCIPLQLILQVADSRAEDERGCVVQFARGAPPTDDLNRRGGVHSWLTAVEFASLETKTGAPLSDILR